MANKNFFSVLYFIRKMGDCRQPPNILDKGTCPKDFIR